MLLEVDIELARDRETQCYSSEARPVDSSPYIRYDRKISGTDRQQNIPSVRVVPLIDPFRLVPKRKESSTKLMPAG